jgi:hypothetical protein
LRTIKQLEKHLKAVEHSANPNKMNDAHE